MSFRYQQTAFASLRAVVVMGAAAALAEIPTVDANSVLVMGLGAAVGCAAASFQINPRRGLGLVAPAFTGLFLLLLATTIFHFAWSPLFCLALGLFAGAAGPAWRSMIQTVAPSLPAVPLDAVFAVLTMAPIVLMEKSVLTAVFGLAAVVAWALFVVPALELFVAILMWPMYDIRVSGPGADRIPRRGPVLLLANHSSYADPFLLSKIVPRKVTPMMTSLFYDLPVVRWLMIHAIDAIRVQTSSFRRDAPELREAVARLRRGDCILLFPEGMLRRKEEQLLLPFGQGVWHILKEAPQTPVVVCWIEGGWGSFASYRGGPPMKNKSLDCRRRIEIAVSEPRTLDASVLIDHRTTRAVLRQACLDCRKFLGLSASDEDEQAATAEPDGNQINP